MKKTMFTMYHEMIWRKRKEVTEALEEATGERRHDLLVELKLLDDLYFDGNLCDPFFEEHDYAYEEK